MAAWGALGPGTRVLLLAVGGSAAVGAGFLGWQALRPVELPVAEAPQEPDVPATATAAAVEAPAQPEAVPAPVPEATPERGLPGIDTWRVAPDGEALVAGLAAPLAVVAVLVDGAKVAEGAALASGEFVLQFTLAPNPAPSLMTLSMTAPGAATVVSDEMVALGPIAGPEIAVATDAGADTTAPATPEAPPLPEALLLTAEGAVVLQKDAPADPALTSQVMIDTITYTPTGEVQVGGRGAGGATVRLYLDNVEAGALAVPAGGLWAVTLGDIAPGIYTLRVDQLDASGQVTSRFETPFQRETREALATAAGLAEPPADAAVVPEAASAAPAEEPEPAGEPVSAAAEPVAVAQDAPATSEAAASVPAVVSAEPVVSTETAAPPPVSPVSLTVQPGFTLWGIAQDQLGDGVLYVQVFEANRDKIKNPDLIYPGQVLSVPAAP